MFRMPPAERASAPTIFWLIVTCGCSGGQTAFLLKLELNHSPDLLPADLEAHKGS